MLLKDLVLDKLCLYYIFNPLVAVNSQLELLDIGPEFANLNVAEKCLRVSEMLGDTYGVDLWTVALYYLKVSAADKKRYKCYNILLYIT